MHLPTSLLTVGLLWAGHATGFALPPFRKCPTRGTSVPVSEKRADLEALAEQLNPRLGFFDPLRLSDNYFWGFDDKDAVSSIGWLRESEIKHGRIAMAACVGYVVQSSWTWPVPMTLNGMPFPSTELGPPAQWDAISIGLKVQIILLIGLLEIYGEIAPHCANNPPSPITPKGANKDTSLCFVEFGIPFCHWIYGIHSMRCPKEQRSRKRGVYFVKSITVVWVSH